MTRTRAVGALFACLCGAQEPVLRTTTRLVQLNVVATDGSGKAVDNLAQDDFTVTEDGKRQAIRVFSVERGEYAASTVAPLPGWWCATRLPARSAR